MIYEAQHSSWAPGVQQHANHQPLAAQSREQVTIAGGVGHPHIKKLAYDLCKAVPLLDADCGLLLDGIKVGGGLPPAFVGVATTGYCCCLCSSVHLKPLALMQHGWQQELLSGCCSHGSIAVRCQQWHKHDAERWCLHPSACTVHSALIPLLPHCRTMWHQGWRSCRSWHCRSCRTCHLSCWLTCWRKVCLLF